METFLNQFMHIYFWVYIIFMAITIIINWDVKTDKIKEFSPINVVGMVLFIMSFKY